ncbi:unnamed protein product [Cuscuta europaea]|uniref:Uncharacterized protein n=1 Tax=Cuscuta europaea TaxID=41803 RepID=A0A9P0ZAW9_CUSEU|nr:unnamed protein product [Cuscuta europaea]
MTRVRVRDISFYSVTDPCFGLLKVRLLTLEQPTPDEDDDHESDEFITFNPAFDLPSLGETISFILSTRFGIDRPWSDSIGLQIFTAALEELEGDEGRFGLLGEMVLETVGDSPEEERRSPAWELDFDGVLRVLGLEAAEYHVGDREADYMDNTILSTLRAAAYDEVEGEDGDMGWMEIMELLKEEVFGGAAEKRAACVWKGFAKGTWSLCCRHVGIDFTTLASFRGCEENTRVLFAEATYPVAFNL